MNEHKWLNCTNVPPMLEFSVGKVSERKLRIFACACCRSIWHVLTKASGRKAVEVSERFADGVVSQRQLAKARRNAQRAWKTTNKAQPQAYGRSPDDGEAGSILIFAIAAAIESTDKNSLMAAWRASTCAAHSMGKNMAILAPDSYAREELAGRRKQYIRQCKLLRDIIGNPFHPVALDTAWKKRSIRALAQAIYDERTYERLSLLANVLEEAGCHDAEILDHCRQPGPHVRGCWVVDLVLGKE
jgi:hypothetical protein